MKFAPNMHPITEPKKCRWIAVRAAVAPYPILGFIRVPDSGLMGDIAVESRGKIWHHRTFRVGKFNDHGHEELAIMSEGASLEWWKLAPGFVAVEGA